MTAVRLAFVIVVVFANVLVVGERHAYAGDRELAKQSYRTGTMLYQRGSYADALVELERGNKADPRPELDYNIGLCLEKLGRAAEAVDAYERFLAARPQDAEAAVLRADITRLRQSLAPATAAPAPSTAVAAPSPASVDRPAPSQSQPYGAPSAAVDFTADAPQPSFVRSTRGRVTIALAAFAGVTLLTSAITGGVALSDRDNYRAHCAAGSCDDASYDDGRRVAVATDVLLGIGLVAAVTATIVGVTRPREHRFAIAPSAGTQGGGIAVAGGF